MTARSVFNLHTPILYVRNATKIPINLRALFTFSSEIKTGFSQKHFSSVSSFRHSNICLHHPIQIVKRFLQQDSLNREKTRKNSHTNKQSDDSHRFKVLNRKTKFLILCSVFGASLWFLSKHLEREHNYELRVRLYKKLPLRSMSRAWGEINSIDLPIWCRKPCFYLYSWVFNCNLNEIDIEDLNEFKNLSEFFRRGLKPDVRVIDQQSCLVSPCDGRILNFGVVDKGYLEQVKGVNYSLKAFLGPQNWPKNSNNEVFQNLNADEAQYEKDILHNPENRLYHCVIYLAPGDYHRFHSPTDWTISFRRHFPGELFSVNPSVARWLQGLFNLNERAVYYGEWKYGFFSMTAVGATNVGSIKVYKDQGLITNNKTSKSYNEKDLDKNFLIDNNLNAENSEGIPIKRGECFGEFNLGSTIVLIFEAPKNFEFGINQNEKVSYGCQLGTSIASTYL